MRQLSSLNPNNEIDEGWQWLDGRILADELANWSSGEPNDCCSTNEEDGEEDYGQFDFYDIKTWNDMRDDSQGGGDSWPIFEFTGTTDVVWGKINPLTGADIIFDGVETSSITDYPNETTTYFYEVTTNGVTCRVETTIVVNPLLLYCQPMIWYFVTIVLMEMHLTAESITLIYRRKSYQYSMGIRLLKYYFL